VEPGGQAVGDTDRDVAGAGPDADIAAGGADAELPGAGVALQHGPQLADTDVAGAAAHPQGRVAAGDRDAPGAGVQPGGRTDDVLDVDLATAGRGIDIAHLVQVDVAAAGTGAHRSQADVGAQVAGSGHRCDVDAFRDGEPEVRVGRQPLRG